MKNLLNWSVLMPLDRYAGGHDEHMKNLFRGATVLAHWNEGYYQGSVATAVKMEDGRFTYYSDYYGSCSGCDVWEDADNEQVRRLCEELADNAKTFDTLDSMLTSLDAEQEPFAYELAKEIRATTAPPPSDVVEVPREEWEALSAFANAGDALREEAYNWAEGNLFITQLRACDEAKARLRALRSAEPKGGA